MPYVDKTPDREKLYPFIDLLVAEMLNVQKDEDLAALTPRIEALADAILRLDRHYNYFGAFGGELNFSMHTIMLRMLLSTRRFTPFALKYFRLALLAGCIDEIAAIFRGNDVSMAKSVYNSRRDKIEKVAPELHFAYVTMWVWVQLICATAPDSSLPARHIILGVIRHMDIEFYGRVGRKYEDKQIRSPKRGDLPEYEELLAEAE